MCKLHHNDEPGGHQRRRIPGGHAPPRNTSSHAPEITPRARTLAVPVIFLGADTPELATRHVAAAIEALRTHDVVIGPAEDGGYYLIGM
ncbi:MAG: DUF2064 domain-containing protein, partial [Porphyrobacter sp.]|nr:DUF2064 domain-containing protein [Porphyrobacter sp.]